MGDSIQEGLIRIYALLRPRGAVEHGAVVECAVGVMRESGVHPRALEGLGYWCLLLVSLPCGISSIPTLSIRISPLCPRHDPIEEKPTHLGKINTKRIDLHAMQEPSEALPEAAQTLMQQLEMHKVGLEVGHAVGELGEGGLEGVERGVEGGVFGGGVGGAAEGVAGGGPEGGCGNWGWGGRCACASSGGGAGVLVVVGGGGLGVWSGHGWWERVWTVGGAYGLSWLAWHRRRPIVCKGVSSCSIGASIIVSAQRSNASVSSVCGETVGASPHYCFG